MKPLKDLVTGRDNETHDLGRWSWVGSFVLIVAYVVWAMWHKIQVSILEVAEGLSAVAGAHGAALWAKKDTEPEKKKDAEPTETP